MNRRRYQRRPRRAGGFLLAVLLLAVAASALMLLRGRLAPVMAYPDVEGVDARAAAMPRPLLPVKMNDPDAFSYAIQRRIALSSASAEAELYLENPYKNHHLMAVELVLDETGEVIYRSGYLKPGQRVKSAPLDAVLPAGEYAVTANFCAVDFESFDLLGILEQPVTLTVGE